MKKEDLSHFDTKLLTHTNYMFAGCSNLENVIFFNSKNSKMKEMDFMFTLCVNLKNFSLSNFICNNSISMNNIFECCAELEKIDLSKFNAKIKSMEYMFSIIKN